MTKRIICEWSENEVIKSAAARKEIATLGDDLTAAADRIIEEVRQTNPDMAEYLEFSDPSGRDPMKWAEWMLRKNIPPSRFEEMYVKTLPKIGPKRPMKRINDPSLPSWRQYVPVS